MGGSSSAYGGVSKNKIVLIWDDVGSYLSIKLHLIFLDLDRKQSFDFLTSICLLRNRIGYAEAVHHRIAQDSMYGKHT